MVFAANNCTVVRVRPGSVVFTSLALLLFLRVNHAGFHQGMAVYLLTCLVSSVFVIQDIVQYHTLFTDAVCSWSRLACAGLFIRHCPKIQCPASLCMLLRQGTASLAISSCDNVHMVHMTGHAYTHCYTMYCATLQDPDGSKHAEHMSGCI